MVGRIAEKLMVGLVRRFVVGLFRWRWNHDWRYLLGGLVRGHVGGDSMNDRVDRLPCIGLDGLDHRCGSACLPIVARDLPPVAGFRWRYGSSVSGWSLWLEKIGGGSARWYVLGLPSAESARELVGIIYAYASGARGLTE